MNTQEVYDRQVEYFSKPDAQLALRSDGACYYRTPDGNGCAVGCVLPDELYDEEMDAAGGTSVRDLVRDYPEVAEYFANVNIEYLQVSQNAHDRAETVEDFLKEMKKLAKNFGLEIKAP